MQLSSAHTKKVRDMVRTSPLKENEIRRVEGSGEQYITLETTDINQEQYTELYVLSIDGKSHAIYAKINNNSQFDAVE